MAATKEVQIIATYYHKSNGKLNGTVSYLVRSSDGKSHYCTTLIDGIASGCSCPSKRPCYHKKQLEQKATARKEVASQFSAKTMPTWAMQLVIAGTLVAPKAKVITLKAKSIESAPLNGAQQSAGLLSILPSRKKIAS